MKKALDNLVNMDMLQPYDYFHEFGEAGDAMYRELREAMNVKIRTVKDVSDFATALLKDVDMHEWSGKNTKVTKFTGMDGEVSLTPAQTMSLYLLMKRAQAQDHILEGGIRQAPIVRRDRLKTVVVKNYDPVHFTAEQYQEIVSSLTAEQKSIADKLGGYMRTELSDWGNEASMKLYGYEKFTAKNYFPIKSDSNYTRTELAAGDDARVKNMGFTKSTVKHANTPVIIDDIFDVFAQHADDMGTYRAFAPALEDMERIYNYRPIKRQSDPSDDQMSTPPNVKLAIERRVGSRGNEYFKGLMRNLNTGIRSDSASELTKKMLSNYKVAAIGANLRVIVQQPTAIFRAWNFMDAKYLLKGLYGTQTWDAIKEQAPIAQWKDWGYFQLDTGRQMKDIMLGTDSALAKLNEAAMTPIGKADSLTWTVLYRAVEAEIADTTDFAHDSDAYRQAVNERFDEVIDRTQVVDSVMHGSGIMRSGDVFSSIATAFMAEPTKTYNMVRTSFRDAFETGSAAAKRQAGRAAIAYLVSSTATALAASLIDAARDKDPDETYREKYLQSLLGPQGDEGTTGELLLNIFKGNLVSQLNPGNWIPIVKDLISILQEYDIKRMDMTALSGTKKAVDGVQVAMNGEGKVTTGYAITKLAGEVGRLYGIPIANVTREVESIANLGLLMTDAAGVDTYGARFKLDQLRVPLNEDNRNHWIDMGYRATRDGSTETAAEIYDELFGVGVTQDQMDARIRKKVQQTEAYETEQIKVLGKVAADMKNNNEYKNMAERHRKEADEELEAYAAAKALYAQDSKYEMAKWMQKADVGEKKHNISIAQFVLVRVETAPIKGFRDRKGDSITNSKSLQVMDAINEMPGLRESQRKYLYEAFDVGKEVRHYNRTLVKGKLSQMRRKAGK